MSCCTPNTNTSENKPEKKPRAAAQVWKQFYRVGRTDTFFIGKVRMTKVGYITAVIDSTGDKRYVNPLRRVRTDRPVMTKKIRAELVAHADQINALPVYLSTKPLKCLPTVAEAKNDDRGPVSQPTSDNAITGPTS